MHYDNQIAPGNADNECGDHQDIKGRFAGIEVFVVSLICCWLFRAKGCTIWRVQIGSKRQGYSDGQADMLQPSSQVPF